MKVALSGKATRAAFRTGLTLRLTVPRAGRMSTARGVVVARGSASAKRAGTITLRLEPTAKARRAAGMRGVKLSIQVGQGAARGAKTVTVKR